MRVLALFLAVLAIISAAVAVDVQKSFIISYPDNTPDAVLDRARHAIEDAGGIITHNYQFIKGFAAKCGEKVLETVSAWGKEYNARIEEDEVVSAL